MKANELKVGMGVYFNCFDGSKIIVKITRIENDMVYGVSDKGSNHWCNIKDVEPIKFIIKEKE